MNKNDLMKMAECAAMLTTAARQHEDALRRVVAEWDDLPDYSDYAVVGESFAPLAQALADWRTLMSNLFPAPAEDHAALEDLATSLESWK